jgi:dolichol-phosphate mannosyltransferase
MTSGDGDERTLVCVATYNERENLEALLDAVFAALPAAHVLVIDDSSPDGTGELADAYAQRDPRVHVLHRAGKLGLGTAILAGLGYAMEHGYDVAINMDADFSHSPSYLPAIAQGMRDHDVTIGSRYIPGGGVRNWNFTRKFMSWGINVYSRLLLGLKARDCSGGFRGYRIARLRLIDFNDVRSRGYSFQEEFLYHCQRVGCRIGETPIIFENRKFGKSKINPGEAARALGILLLVAMKRWTRSYRRKSA